MRGWVEKHRNGWRGRVLTDDGRKRSSKEFAYKRDAKAWLAAELVDRRRGLKFDITDDSTYAAWADRWMNENQHRWKPKTTESYASLLRSHVLPSFGAVRLSALKLRDGRAWLSQLHDSGLSSSRIRQAVITLRGPVRYAVAEQALPYDPFQALTPPKQTTSRNGQFLSLDQLIRLREAAGYYDPLVWTLGLSGMRWGEVAGLRIDRVNFLHRRITIETTLSEVNGVLHEVPPKSGRARTITVPTSVIDAISTLSPDEDGRLFTMMRGGPLRSANFRTHVWKPLTAEVGLDGLVVHDLRRTAGSLLIAQGAHPREVQEYLGHASIETTMRVYGHVFPDRNQELADRLDRAVASAG